MKELEEYNQENTLWREIKLAQKIQQQLLNVEPPKMDSIQILGKSIPARHVGGDYYDFIRLPNGKLRIVVGDVMGKGIPAAMLMILTRGAFRSAAENTNGPGAALTAINNALFQDLRVLGAFVTLVCVDWDPTTRTISYSSAGHSLPVYVTQNGVKEIPMVKGVMLGGLPNHKYEEKRMEIDPNSFLFFYTDGIIEAQSCDGEQYKLDRLLQLLNGLKDEQDIHSIERKILDSIYGFTKGASQKDDLTMVILRIEKGEAHG